MYLNNYTHVKNFNSHAHVLHCINHMRTRIAISSMFNRFNKLKKIIFTKYDRKIIYFTSEYATDKLEVSCRLGHYKLKRQQGNPNFNLTLPNPNQSKSNQNLNLTQPNQNLNQNRTLT